MKHTVCAICGSNRTTDILYPSTFDEKVLNSKIFSARRMPDKIHYRFIRCNTCGLIYSSPILSNEKIEKLYKKSSFTYSNQASYLSESYGRLLEKLLPNNKREKLKILDIGCGNGFFLEKMRSMGVGNVYGVEPGVSSVARAKKDIKKNIKIGFFNKGMFKKEFFDIICCFHTLDHISNPNAFLRDVFFLLKKKGKVLFVTHDTDGLSVKLLKERSPIFDVEHIYLFNSKTLTRIFKINKFTKTKIFYVKNTYPLLYWIYLFPFPRALKNLSLKVLDFLKIGHIPLSIRAGNIAIAAEKL